jgi:electron transfer flavoprotein alpha subunit
MIFVAFFKQIPDIGFIKIDPATKRLVREGVPNIINPFDLHAVEAALEMRDRFGGSVYAITMGPPAFKQSAEVILSMGVDEVIHLSDRAFAGSDTLATSRALALAIKKFAGAELGAVFAGKYSWDGETGHVGPQVAELLGIPHVSGVVSLEADPPRATAVREVEDGVERVEVDLPAVFTVTDRTNKPRTPGRAAGNYRVVGAAEISDRLDIFGEAGSPTYVADLVEERIERENRVVVDARKSPEEGARAILDFIKKALGEGGPSAERLNPPSGAAGGSEIFVVTEEELSGGVTKASYEILAKASELAAKVGGYVTAIYGGGEKPEELVARGADRVVLLQGADPRDYMAHADALTRLVTERRPWAVLAPSTSYGRDVLARAAARLGLGLTADCVNLDVVDGRLAQFKPAFGGAVVSVIYSKTTPYMATARPGMFPPYSPDYGRRGEVIEMRIEPRLRFAAREAARWELPDPREAEVVVGVGMGLKRRENVAYAVELAKLLGGAVAATRNVVLAGWLPYHVQVGVSGKAIAPRLYLALGIRGDINHLVGIRRAKHIAAVNINKHADIFKAANLGVVGDAVKISQLLIELLKA